MSVVAFDVLPVILHPAHDPAFLDNAVIHVVHVAVLAGNLLSNRSFYRFQLFRMHDPAERALRVSVKIVEVVAIKNFNQRVVCVYDFFVFFGGVYKKAAGDLVDKFLDLQCGIELLLFRNGKGVLNIFILPIASVQQIEHRLNNTFSRVPYVHKRSFAYLAVIFLYFITFFAVGQ